MSSPLFVCAPVGGCAAAKQCRSAVARNARVVNPTPERSARWMPRSDFIGASPCHISAAGLRSEARGVLAGYTTMVFAAAGRSSKAEEAKNALFAAIKPSRIGREAVRSDSMRARIDAAIRAVEACNPSADPLTDPNLNARWKLIYTDSEEILGTKRPVGFRPNDEIFQTIDATNGTAKNEETVPILGALKVLNFVEAEIRPEPPRRVQVQFKRFGVGGALKITAPPSARGWLDVTYLDRDLRISRGNKNHVFVLVRVP